MDPERIIDQIGGFGRYQKVQYFLFSILWVGCGIQVYLSVFILYIPPFRCALPGLSNDSYSRRPARINESIPFEEDQNGHLEYSQCQILKQENSTNTMISHFANVSHHDKVSCHRWVYDKSQVSESAATEMNFVCDRTTLVSIMNMLFMVGSLLASFIFGIMADKKGRKLTLYVCIVLYLASVLPLYIVNEPITFGILRMTTGAAVQGVFMNTFILGPGLFFICESWKLLLSRLANLPCADSLVIFGFWTFLGIIRAMEMVSCSQRSAVGPQSKNCVALGEIVVVAIGYLVREWHLHSLCVGAIFLPCLVYWLLIQESPRWLVSTGRLEEAKKIFTLMAEKNQVPVPYLEVQEKLIEEKQVQNVGLKELFRSRILLIRSLIIFFNWAVINMVYFGLMFNTGNLSNNLYLSALLSGLVEFPAYTILIFTMDRWGRKPLFCTSTIFSGLSCIASALVNIWFKDITWLSLTLALLGKFAISSSCAIYYNLTTELFPTAVRTAALGFSSCAGRAGCIVAPYIILAGTLIPSKFGHAMPLVLFGAFSLVGGLLSLMLPETLGRKLPETIEDGENIGREPKEISKEINDNEALNIEMD